MKQTDEAQAVDTKSGPFDREYTVHHLCERCAETCKQTEEHHKILRCPSYRDIP